eukprot:252094_1
MSEDEYDDEEEEEDINEEYDDALDELYYDLYDYYDDYDDLYDYEDVSDNEEYRISEKAHFYDNNDDNEWVVSSLSTSDLDNVWEDPKQWEYVDRIKTENGRIIQRKCLHMWKHRLCLCQFLEWIDDAKYKCFPRGQQIPIMKKTPRAIIRQQTAPKVVKKFKKIIKKLKAAKKPTPGKPIIPKVQKPLLKKLAKDIKKLEKLEKKKAAKSGKKTNTKPLLKKLAVQLAKKAIKKQVIKQKASQKGKRSKYANGGKTIPIKKLAKQAINAGNGVKAMEEINDVAAQPMAVGSSAQHGAQLSRIEALLTHLLAKKQGKQMGKIATNSQSSESAEHGYTTPDEVRRRYRHSERLWRKRQRGIGPGMGKKKKEWFWSCSWWII